MKFTDLKVRNLKPKAKRYVEFEDNAHGQGTLGVRVTPSGTKSFIHFYKIDGRKRMTTLGRYPRMTVAEAHEAFAVAARAVTEGGDPASGAVAENVRRRRAWKVSDLAEEYMEKWAKAPQPNGEPRKRSWEQDQGMIDNHVLPSIGNLRLEDVRRRDIVDLLDGIVAAGSPVQANRVRALVNMMFNFGVARDLIEFNPCHGVPVPTTETGRDRALTASEVKVLLEGLPESPMWTATQLALLFLLVTGQRPGEAVGVEWADINVPDRWWTIPAVKVKKKKTHGLPLSPQAMQILTLAKAQDMGTGAVFPSKRGGGLMVHSVFVPGLARARPVLGIAHFTAHDLRRTATTHMSEMGTLRLVLQKILNHSDGSVTSVYDRYEYASEKREALEAWGRRLDELGLQDCLNAIESVIKRRQASRWWQARHGGKQSDSGSDGSGS